MVTMSSDVQVVVHLDAAVLADASRDGRAEIENGPPLAIETVRRLLLRGEHCTDDGRIGLRDNRGAPNLRTNHQSSNTQLDASTTKASPRRERSRKDSQLSQVAYPR